MNFSSKINENEKVTIIIGSVYVTVSAPLNNIGTPIVCNNFNIKLNKMERVVFNKIFSDHSIDRDLGNNSNFLNSLSLDY